MIKPRYYLLKRLLLLHLPILIFLAVILFPLYWTAVTALKNPDDIIRIPIDYLPRPVTFANFADAWNNVGFSVYFRNSFVVAIVSMAAVTFFSIFVGYSLARFKFKGKNVFMLMLLCTQFIPQAMLIVPLFLIFKGIGLINNLAALIIINTTMQLSFNSILMRGFVSGIPYELEEAAIIDGCGRIGAIMRTVVPVLLPGLVATGAFAFVGVWNEFLFAFMFINKQTLYTIPVGLKSLIGEFTINYGVLAAGSIIALVPALILFIYLQKYLIAGLSAGSVKG